MSATKLWVIDRTNQRGDEVLERNCAGIAMPRHLAEEVVRRFLAEKPDEFYAIREEKEEEAK